MSGLPHTEMLLMPESLHIIILLPLPAASYKYRRDYAQVPPPRFHTCLLAAGREVVHVQFEMAEQMFRSLQHAHCNPWPCRICLLCRPRRRL